MAQEAKADLDLLEVGGWAGTCVAPILVYGCNPANTKFNGETPISFYGTGIPLLDGETEAFLVFSQLQAESWREMALFMLHCAKSVVTNFCHEAETCEALTWGGKQIL